MGSKKYHGYKPLIRIRGSCSHQVKPQSRGSKGKDTRNREGGQKMEAKARKLRSSKEPSESILYPFYYSLFKNICKSIWWQKAKKQCGFMVKKRRHKCRSKFIRAICALLHSFYLLTRLSGPNRFNQPSKYIIGCQGVTQLVGLVPVL